MAITAGRTGEGHGRAAAGDGMRRISLRTALVALIAASVIPCAVLVHLTWWRTTLAVSRNLVDTLELQITEAVRRAWWGRVLEVQGLSRTLHQALDTSPNAESAERILATAATSMPALSWLVHVPRSGRDVIAIVDETAERTRLFRTDQDGRVQAALDVARSPLGLTPIAAPETRLAILSEGWAAEARSFDEPGWVDVARTPAGGERAVAYVDPTGGALLAAMIGYERFAELLGAIPVGRTGRSYVLGPDGRIVIASRAPDGVAPAALDPVALAAGRVVAARPAATLNVNEKTRLDVGGATYAVGLSPLWFQGWQLAVIVPEAEFLGEINSTIGWVAMGLAFFVLLAGAGGVLAARHLVGGPIARVVADLAHIERFELEAVPRRVSRLSDIDRLSEAIVRMSLSLADFAKFIPTDLVRSLVAEGVRAQPGGSRREITVLFADLAGFTGLSERLGDAAVPVVSGFLEAASRAVAAEGGTVDKFIGDAIMAFWGAPRADPDQAARACRAGLAIARCLDGLALPPEVRAALAVRVGVQSGPAIVGNVGSANRLNYTALGDTVNLASRLEGVNKRYGTTVLIGSSTRDRAGPAIMVREVDTVAVYGRAEEVTIFELIGLAEDGPRPGWAEAYEEALAAYRAGRFAEALAGLATLRRDRPEDGPAARLAAACEAFLRNKPGAEWRPVTALDEK
ncbi:MAG: adenylate/guanylate cyclase domain-containing protein [Methylobacteriaceae bacterium]|nr:adenylate/guanylate cyclase domain-containing protein [Methylobacteriaceae bacterium]